MTDESSLSNRRRRAVDPVILLVIAVALASGADSARAQTSMSIVTQTSNGSTNLIAPAPVSSFVAGLDVSSAAAKATGGTVARTVAGRAADVINIADYGAVADMTTLASTAYTIAASSTALAASAGVFTSAMVGKTIVLPGAGTSGAGLVSVIASYTDAQHVTLTTAATTALSAVTEYAEVGTDNTAAINAAITAAKARTSSLGSGLNYVGTLYVPDGSYLVQTLNFTDIKSNGFRVMGQGQFWGVNAGAPVVDMLGTRYTRWSGVNIRGDQYAMPSIGLQLGRINSTLNDSSDNNSFDHFYIGGYFSSASMLNEQSETTDFDKVHFFNGNPAASYAVIMDGYHHFSAASQYVTNNEPADTIQSFDENVFVNCIFSGYTALWIGGVNRMDVIGGYANVAGAYGALLYNEVGYDTQLNLDLHIESQSSTGMTDDFLITGSGVTSAIIEGFNWREHASMATNSMFKVDSTSGITSVRMSNANIDLFTLANGATKLFDSATPWTVTGHIYVPAAADMNLSTFSGTLETPSSITDTSSIPAATVQSDLATQGLTLGAGPVGSVSITNGGAYYGVTGSSYLPTVTFGAAPSGGTTATGHVSTLGFYGQGSLATAGTGYTVANNVPVQDAAGNSVFTVNITSIGTGGTITALTMNAASQALTTVPAAPLSVVQTGASGATITGYNVKVTGVAIDAGGSGYTTAPAVTFSSTHASPAATGTAGVLTSVTLNGPLTSSGSLTGASLQVSGAAKIGAWPVTTESGSYTFTASDCGSDIEYAGTTNVTWTLPTGLATGCRIAILQRGTGTVTLAGASGITAEEYVSSGSKSYATAGQFSQALLTVDSSSTFLLTGQVD